MLGDEQGQVMDSVPVAQLCAFLWVSVLSWSTFFVSKVCVDGSDVAAVWFVEYL